MLITSQHTEVNHVSYPEILVDRSDSTEGSVGVQNSLGWYPQNGNAWNADKPVEPLRLNVLMLGRTGRSHALLKERANGWGHQLWLAHSRRALEDIANRAPIHVLLLDLQVGLPQVSVVAQWFKRKWRNGKCLTIAIMNRADLDQVKVASVAGIDLSLLDPVDHNVLEMLLLLEATFINRNNHNCRGIAMQL